METYRVVRGRADCPHLAGAHSNLAPGYRVCVQTSRIGRAAGRGSDRGSIAELHGANNTIRTIEGMDSVMKLRVCVDSQQDYVRCLAFS
jgi:hypothetical protein